MTWNCHLCLTTTGAHCPGSCLKTKRSPQRPLVQFGCRQIHHLGGDVSRASQHSPGRAQCPRLAVARAFDQLPMALAGASQDALVDRLAPLQAELPVHFPRPWLGKVLPSAEHFLVRLTRLPSTALEVNFLVKPFATGIAWPPEVGPTMVFEGVGQGRNTFERNLTGRPTGPKPWPNGWA